MNTLLNSYFLIPFNIRVLFSLGNGQIGFCNLLKFKGDSAENIQDQKLAKLGNHVFSPQNKDTAPMTLFVFTQINISPTLVYTVLYTTVHSTHKFTYFYAADSTHYTIDMFN